MMYNSGHIKFEISIKLALTPMGSGDSLFEHTIGEIFQGYDVLKMEILHPSGDHYSYSHSNIGIDP